ncbi:MAG: hypothetical protein LBC02_14875 [Planctomycetaceae bacterium]|nr:hypothetical protein [Planctomycetaceae bacterium]
MILFVPLSFASENSLDIPVDTREKLYSCGYNSLYLFLRLKGYNVSFESVKDKTQIKQTGTSFFDLQTGAAAFNVKTQTVQCSYETLQKLSYPVIAWIDRSKTKSPEKVIGHFIVIISCTPEYITYFDGTSAEKTNMSVTNFKKQWNGMILMEQNQSSIISNNFGIICFLFGLFCVILTKIFDKKTIVSSLVFVIIFLGYCSQSYAMEESVGIWRKPENESINALYLLLKCHELPCDYHVLESEFKQFSQNTDLYLLQKQAKKYGLTMSVFHSRSPEVLNKLPIPFLIHMESGNEKNETIWKGNYLLVIGRGNKNYMIVECGAVQMSDIPEEMLRRYWSGYVLAKIPKQKTSFIFSPMFFSGIIGVGILFLYLGFTTQRTNNKKNKNAAALTLFALCSGIFASQSLFAESPPEAKYSADEIKQVLLETASAIKSLRVTYRSEYYTNPDAPKGTYLYRKILMMSPYFLNHTNSHPCDLFSWENDPLLQQAFIQKEIGYNIFPFCSVYFVMKHSPTDGLSGTLPGEFFFNATGIWVMEQRKAPTWEEIPVSLRDVANHPEYNYVRPLQEKISDRWCHVLSWSERDTLWLDMEHGGVLTARETFHPKTGVLMQRYELSHHEEVVPKIWIPRKLRNIQFDFSAKTEEGQKRRVIDGCFNIDEVEVNNLTESDFDFTPPHGALLTYDAQNPNAEYPYQSVPGGEELLDRLADWIQSMQSQQKVRKTTSYWEWGIGCLVIPVIILLEIRRRLKLK